MFKDCSIMIIKAGSYPEEIYRVEVDKETQEAICATFADALEELTENKSKIVFDGSYKTNNDEILYIENFQLSDEIKDAIRNPLGVQTYEAKEGVFPDIRAIFIGEKIEIGDSEKFNVAFQKFRREQYISTKWYNLFFDKNTFMQEKRFGISIANGVDCFFSGGELQFSSFHFARQIFQLNEYYRSATDSEVDAFVTNSKLQLEAPEEFKELANTWIRRKIAMINDSNVLVNYSASEIKKRASLIDIEIEIKNKKVVIPNDRDKIRTVLGFLDEEAYKGPFSNNTYLANSKRKITQV